MKYNASVTRIAHDLCNLTGGDWEGGRKLYLAMAQEIYDREIKPLRRFLVLITEEVPAVLAAPLNYVQFDRLSGLVTNAILKLAELRTVKGPSA